MNYFSQGVLDSKEIQNLPLKAKKALIYWQPQFLFCLNNPEPILVVKALLSNGFIIEQLNRDLTVKEFSILLKTNYFMQKGNGKDKLIDKIIINNKFPKRIQNAIFKKTMLFNIYVPETGLFKKCYKNFEFEIVKEWVKKFPSLILEMDEMNLELVDLLLLSPDALMTFFLNQIIEKILNSKNVSNIQKLVYCKKFLIKDKSVQIASIPAELTEYMDKIDFLNSKIGMLKRINSQIES